MLVNGAILAKVNFNIFRIGISFGRSKSSQIMDIVSIINSAYNGKAIYHIFKTQKYEYLRYNKVKDELST